MSIIYKPSDVIANGRYHILRLVGEGGAGTVYQAKDIKTLNDVAIKVLRHEFTEDNKQIEIFQHEAHLAAQLQHPNIVAVQESVVDHYHGQTNYLLVMEYLSGGSLVAQIGSGINIDTAMNWIKQLLRGTAYAHEKGIIHQDIKSANVFLTTDGDVKIGDFGLARMVDNVHCNNTALPQKKGTPAYMSPELCYGEIQDERSDIYSLGVLFFELLTGRLPFEADGMIELARQHISKPVPSIRRLNPQLSDNLDNIVRRMMCKQKDERYQSARQILNLIDEVL